MSDPYLGEIRMFAGTWAPRNWAFCDGSILQISEHDMLYSLLSNRYGGDGITTFWLPDLRGRIPIHYGTGTGLSPHYLGDRVGTEMAYLSADQLPAHRHGLMPADSAATATGPIGEVPANATIYKDQDPDTNLDPAAVASEGGSQSHNNMQPFLCIHFIIAMVGTYPPRS